jgi:prepilin-type processing-associated H-X9-DG protein
VNQVFLSPLIILPDAPARSTDFMTGESHGFFEAVKPSRTVFYLPSTRGYLPQFSGDNIGALDVNRGFFGVNAPGMMPLGANSFPYVLFVQNTDCSGDWCGADVDPNTDGVQTRQNFAYFDSGSQGNNVAMLDGHVQFMTISQLTAGTDYPTALPNDPNNQGGCLITDKTKYVWNLDDNFFGVY